MVKYLHCKSDTVCYQFLLKMYSVSSLPHFLLNYRAEHIWNWKRMQTVKPIYPRDTKILCTKIEKNKTMKSEHADRRDLRSKQTRLLLFRHVPLCRHANGKCPITPLCSSVKKLWIHINTCNDSSCEVKHCRSSRKIMKHYCNCIDAQCEICIPVRRTFQHRPNRKRFRTVSE